MTQGEQSSKLATEGTARVLSEVKGRLERMETGDLPVIQRVGPDGSVRQVDPTGEMIRPDPTPAPAPVAAPAASEPALPPVASPAARPGLWARIRAWFRRG